MVQVIAWSPNGRRLAVGTENHLHVWDLITNVSVEFPREGSIYSLAWTPDGKFLAAGYYEIPEVSVWDADTASLHRRFGKEMEDHRSNLNSVFSIAWSPAGDAIAFGHGGGSIEVWDPTTWRPISEAKYSRVLIDLAWSPDGALVGGAGFAPKIQVFDAKTGKEGVAIDVTSDRCNTLAWSPEGQLLASGSSDGAVLLCDPHAGAQLKRLEGHLEQVICVRFSSDGSLLASSSEDDTVRIWDPITGAPLTVLNAAHGTSLGQTIAFDPSGPRLAALNEQATGVCIWQLDSQQLAAAKVEAIRYATARIVLVGESGVGKTGLGWRLAHDEFKEHPSTHGQQFWTLDQLQATRADGAQCEAVLWDLAGQPDYRLVHSLFLDTVDLALLLFDPTNRLEPLAGVDYWLQHLQAGKSNPPSIILVGARIDRGSSTLTDAEIAAYCEQHGMSGGYIATSAKDGDGLDYLLAQVKSLIPWEAMSATVTTATFKRVRDYVLSLKENAAQSGVLVSAPVLRQRLQATDANWRFSDAEMITAVRHLETHGYVKILRSTGGDELVLLLPEVLSNLASSIVLEARREVHGLGALDEARLLEGDYRLPELDNLDHEERRILIDAVVLLFLEHNICFREYLGSRVLLVFPSLINEQRPIVSDSPTVGDVSYRLSGAVENVYAALVVLLGYTNTFSRTHQWQNQAQYELGDGEICGFRQVDQGKGAAELVLYYGMTTPARVKLLFQGLFETFLTRRDLNIVRYQPVNCPQCGEQQDRAVVMRQVGRGRSLIFCANCGSKLDVPRPDDLTVAVSSNQEVQLQKKVANRRTAFEAGVVGVKSLLLERHDAQARPTCFISYAWGVAEDERWVMQLAKDLRNADVDVLLDRWHSPPGSDLGRYIDRILSSHFVIVVGTPELRQKYETNSSDPVVAAELELIDLRLRQPHHYGRTVLPLLFHGAAHEAFTPLLEKLVNIDFRKEDLYFSQLFALIWQLHSLPFDHPLLEELIDSNGVLGLDSLGA